MVAWAFGDSSAARRVRSEVSRVVGAGRERLGGREDSAFLRWVGRYRGVLQVVGIVLAFIVMFAMSTLTVLGLLIVLAILGLYLLLLAMVPAPAEADGADEADGDDGDVGAEEPSHPLPQ